MFLMRTPATPWHREDFVQNVVQRIVTLLLSKSFF